MNKDNISARFSSLGITDENSQLIPRESLVTDTLPPRSTTTFLSLPWLVKWHIYAYLPSRDCIALSRTCREMYSLNTFAYTHLQFLLPNSLYSLSRSVYKLAEVLACSPHYARAVRTIRIAGWNAAHIPEGCNHEAVYKLLDEGVAAVLDKAPRIYSFTLDFNPTGGINYFPQTFIMLARVRTIRNLHLATFLVPTTHVAASDLLERIHEEAPSALERVWLCVCSGGWLPVVMRNPRNLRWFGFRIFHQAGALEDTNWVMTLHHIAGAATELETIVLENGRNFDADALGQMFQSGFECGILGKLRSFSVNSSALCLDRLRQLFRGFSRSSVTHLRIVVNHTGVWLGGFGPQYISELAGLVPDLEEISLDELGMVKAEPLPGHLDAWGEAFRMFKKLRRIAFASIFVLDLCRPRPVDSDEGEDEEDEVETGGDEDIDMDVDDSHDEGVEGYETDGGKTYGTPRWIEDVLEVNLVQLAAWADMFLGDHLRMLAPFGEIWFLDHRFARQTAAGYNQLVGEGEGEGGRAEHMICNPNRMRDGWWWDQHAEIALD